MTTLNKDLAAIQLNQVIEVITDMDNEDTISIYNDYANNNGYELIFNNDEHTINDLFLTPYDAIRQTNNKDYKDHENYFTFNGYGHAVSFDYRLSDNSPIDISELAEWLISEDKLAEYDITVATLEDMLASIEDNITDDENMLHSFMDYLNIGYDIEKSSLLGADYETSLIEEIMDFISGYDYSQLSDIINCLNIDYQ